VIDLRVPIVQAPLAGGPSTPELAAAVSDAGGLGFVAAGYLAPDALREQLRRARALTRSPIGVNLFVLEDRPVDDIAVAAYADELAAEGLLLGEPHFDDDAFAEKLAVAIGERMPVVSTTFGFPSRDAVDAVHAAGAELWATVTTLEEARAARDGGADALVLQGAEAGGHRGSWSDADGPDLTTIELVRTVASDVNMHLVAAGGIADARDVKRVLAVGATYAQAGTAFLLCPEAGTSEPHRRALGSGGETAVTRAFTGRRARGIVNRFMREHPNAPRAYPQVHHLTAPLRAAARAAGDTDRINLWAGTAFARAQPLPAAEVVAALGCP
jgi:nitronate monooxygenase